ncbi:hypothetical protein PInf_020359 [Phytophthora infestans]|nr:hypothetical protein PInf_020359 [Phytophthora infestans]
MIELLAEATEWCVWLAGICWAFGWSVVRHPWTEMAWAAAVRHWSGLLWALSGAVGWMITKPLWCVVGRIVGAVLEFVIKWTGLCKTCIRRYRIFADYVRIAERTPAVRRWKLYEALFQTPMVVLEDEAESEDGLGRLAHRWLEAYHALWCVFLPDVLELSCKSTVKYWIGSSAECHRAMDRACCVFRAFAILIGLFAYAGLYTAVYVYEFVEWILYGSCGVGALLLLGNYVLAERHFGVDGGFAWNDDMVLASGLTVLLAVTSRLLQWGEASKGRRTPKQVAEDRYARWTKDLEEQEQAERLSEAFWKADGCVGPKPKVRRLSEVRARRDAHRARKADQGPTGARRGRQASVGEGVTSGSGGHRLGHGEFRYPPPLFSTADQIRVGHAFDEAMQGHDGVAESCGPASVSVGQARLERTVPVDDEDGSHGGPELLKDSVSSRAGRKEEERVILEGIPEDETEQVLMPNLYARSADVETRDGASTASVTKFVVSALASIGSDVSAGGVLARGGGASFGELVAASKPGPTHELRATKEFVNKTAPRDKLAEETNMTLVGVAIVAATEAMKAVFETVEDAEVKAVEVDCQVND